jgi:surface protein
MGGLTSISLHSWNSVNLTNARKIFYNCNSLQDVDLSHMKFDSLTDLSEGFRSCENIQTIGLPSTSGDYINMSHTFYGCEDLSSTPGSNSTLKISSLDNTFNMCKSLTTIDLTNWDLTGYTGGVNMSHTFTECDNVTNIYLPNANVTNLVATFSLCSKIETIDVNNINTHNVTNMTATFYKLGKNSSTTPSLNLNSWDFSNVTNMTNFLSKAKISNSDYSYIIIRISNTTTKFNVTLDADGLEIDTNVSGAQASRDYLINVRNWTINDDT